MSTVAAELAKLQYAVEKNPWAERIVAELTYAYYLSKTRGNKYHDIIRKALDYVVRSSQTAGAITSDDVVQAENILMPLSGDAKSLEMICAAHAHIDMNWMWRWDETVAITLDTFRTMLDLMKEYPEFTFSQSQASVYKIVAETAPKMLEEIKERIKEGRWEVTASTWVESDKNMPNGESMARHILYTKKYLSELLEIDPDSLTIDFEPDTFGHNINVPEALTGGGIKYYYHCRGDEGTYLVRWKAPSGRSIIVYREPFWYNAAIEPNMAYAVPQFCADYDLTKCLKVYGVGDHGGGPTRRDIEKIIAMNNWPIFPRIKFGTFHEFFAEVERVYGESAGEKAKSLPEVTGERNFIFTGCYTSQSRIKRANRISEATLYEAEMWNSLASLTTGESYDSAKFAAAWQNVLFNQFHDIIPGSGVVDTREYAMGLFQDTLAKANSAKKLSLSAIASQIDTSQLPCGTDLADTTAEGAGVGFGTERFQMSQPSRGAGLIRIFHVFNSALTPRTEVTEVVLWDWNGDLAKLVCEDAHGNVVPHQILDHGFNQYWGHRFARILIKATAPAGGYTTYVLRQADDFELAVSYPKEPRLETPDELVLENSYIRAVFDPVTCALVSLVDKAKNQELVDPNRPAGIFRLIQEDPGKGMTAWRVGRYMQIEDLTKNVKIVSVDKGPLRQSFTFKVEFASSYLQATVSLDETAPRLNYAVKCDWHEIGRPETSIPQLNFYVPVGYQCTQYKYDVPFGVIRRNAMDLDVPGNSFILGENPDADGAQLMVITDSKYGFRGNKQAMAVTLIRSSFDPDPYPENGIHEFNLAIQVDHGSCNAGLLQTTCRYNHPFTVLSGTHHPGSLPLELSFASVEGGSAAVSAIKLSEPAQGTTRDLIVRLYETNGSTTEVVLALPRPVEKAVFVDLNEKPIPTQGSPRVDGCTVTIPVEAYQVATVKLSLKA